MPESDDAVFECRQCGDCCFGRGGTRLDQAGSEAAARFLELDPAEFRRLYLAPGEAPWDIRTDFEGYCLFHQPGGHCLIHPVKPPLCRLWPFLPGPLADESAFLEAKAACPGLARDLNWADFKTAGAETAEK
jgi:Fe-S-cluster containining protein